MTRTQIYLTEEEVAAVESLAARSKMKKSEVIRAAVDEYVEAHRDATRKASLAAGKGIWKDRLDLPDPRVLRHEWDGRHIA